MKVTTGEIGKIPVQGAYKENMNYFYMTVCVRTNSDENPHLFCLSQQYSRSSQVVHSLPQLRNRCSTNSFVNCRVSSEVWCFCTAHSLHPVRTRSVLTRDRADMLNGSRPLAFRLICTVDFSHISICESFCVDRSGCRHRRLGVGTVQNIVSIQLPSSTFCSASTSSHERSGW